MLIYHVPPFTMKPYNLYLPYKQPTQCKEEIQDKPQTYCCTEITTRQLAIKDL